MVTVTYRLLHPDESKFLEEMLYEAIFMPQEQKEKLPKDFIYQPDLARYFINWGRVGDLAVVANSDESKSLIGCAWGRLFSEKDKGYGYINQEIPEFSVAVISEYRNKGIGFQLLRELICKYKSLNFNTFSLSVTKENPGLRLYKRLGFTICEDKSDSFTMMYSVK